MSDRLDSPQLWLGACVGAQLLLVFFCVITANAYRERALLLHAAATLMAVVAVHALIGNNPVLPPAVLLFVPSLAGLQLLDLVSHAGAMRQGRRWLLVVSAGVLPVMATVNAPDQTSAWAYGWDEVADVVRQLKADNDIGFVAATDYALTSPLAFALRDRDVTSVSSHRDGYDDWFVPEAHRGQTAIIVADYWRQLDPAFAAQFKSVETARLLDVTRFGKVLDHYTIYSARGFSPEQGQD